MSRPAKQTPQKRAPMPWVGQSPPTRDPGPKPQEEGKLAPLSLEIYKLQYELDVYMQKVEQLSNRGKLLKQIVTVGLCLTVDHMFKGTAQNCH